MAIISFDYQSILNRMLTNLKGKSAWAEFLNYGVAENLYAPIAQEMAYQMGYGEYETVENMWSKARNRSSLLVQSPVHGYKVPRKKGATGELEISTSKNFDEVYSGGVNIQIPKFFEFSGNDIYVVSALTYTLSPSAESIKIRCKQGEYKSVFFLANGDIYETKEISDNSVDNDFFELYVNDVLWKCVDTLFESSGEDLVYEISTKKDLSGIVLKFGNDVFGRKLRTNDRVEFKYISTAGTQGIVYAPYIIDTVESQAFDSNGRPVKLYVRNTSAIMGGEDYPSLETIRTLSPRVYQTGDRASNVDDYITKISQFSYISKVNVWGAYETLLDEGKDLWEYISSDQNVVHLALLDLSYENLSDAEKTQVIKDLHAKCDPTDLISFETVTKIPLVFNVDATVKNSSYSLIQVKTNIETTLKDAYMIENMDFGVNIYNSDFVSMIDSVEGVRNHISSILLKEDNIMFSYSYFLQFSLPIYPIDYRKFSIYIEDTTEENPEYRLLAVSDINGSIVGVEGYNTGGSEINLTNGKGKLIVNSGLTKFYEDYRLRIMYASESIDLLLNNRADIFTYDSSDITVKYPSN